MASRQSRLHTDVQGAGEVRKIEKRACSLPPTSRSLSKYNFLALQSGFIRLLRLMPHRDKHAPIQCELIDHFLLNPDSGEGPHLYEALSYVWGSAGTSKVVYTEAGFITVTQNLYAALLRLRNRTFPRIIWADGICINQNDVQERGVQVQLMAIIYAKATGVVVWLEEQIEGEASTNGGQALEAIRAAAKAQPTVTWFNTTTRPAVVELFQRSWFQRVWVLQEVSAARKILLMTWSDEIEGYTFWLGLRAIEFGPKDQRITSLVLSTARLFESSVSRSKYFNARVNRLSLGIAPLGQLIDMYHTRKATDRRDKVYALLGMSSDNNITNSLSANYSITITWENLFNQLIKFVIGQEASADTWSEEEFAVIRTKGFIFGVVDGANSNTSDGKQTIRIEMAQSHYSLVWDWFSPSCSESEMYPYNMPGRYHTYVVQESANLISKGDIVCLFQGASQVSIIRKFQDYCAIVATTVTAIEDRAYTNSLYALPRLIRSSQSDFPFNFLLLWDWNWSSGWLKNCNNYKSLQCRILDHLNIQLSNRWDETARLHIMGLMLLEVPHKFTTYERLLSQKPPAYELLLRVIQLYAGESAVELLDTLKVSSTDCENDAARLGLIANIIGRKEDAISIAQDDLLKAARWHDLKLMKFLLDRKGNEVQITDRVLEAATANKDHGNELITFLASKQISETVITEKMLIEAVKSEESTKTLTTLLLNERVDKVIITEEVLARAVQEGDHISELMALSLSRVDSTSLITERVLVKATGNLGCQKKMVTLLLGQQFDKKSITTRVLENAASDIEILEPLINYAGGQISVPEEVFREAVRYGRSSAQFLLDRYGHQPANVHWSQIMTESRTR